MECFRASNCSIKNLKEFFNDAPNASERTPPTLPTPPETGQRSQPKALYPHFKQALLKSHPLLPVSIQIGRPR
jgi:hypothetical protein